MNWGDFISRISIKKKISIIVPVYNVAHYITQCVCSILSQTYSSFELILVDDGSKDKSGMICDQIAEEDNRIKVIHTKNQGVSSARNEGLKHAVGEYIYFMDADDWLEQEMLEKMVEGIEKSGSDMAVCGYYVDCRDSATSRCMDRNMILNREQLMSRMYVPAEINGVVWNKLFHRKLIYKNENVPKNIFCTDYSMWEDVLWVTETCVEVEKAYYIAKPYYHYLKRNDSATARGFQTEKCTMVPAGMAIRDVLIKERVESSVIRIFDNYMHLHFRGTIYEIYTFSPQYKYYIKYFRDACFKVESFGMLSRNSMIHHTLLVIHPRLDSILISLLEKIK